MCYRSKVYLWSTPVCECLIQCSHRALNPSSEKHAVAWRGASRTCEPVHCYRNSSIHRIAAVVAFLPPPLLRYTLFACEDLIKIWNTQLAITAHCDFWREYSWGTIRTLRGTIWTQNNSLSRTLGTIVPATHLLKVTSSPAAYLLLNFTYFNEPSQAKSVYLGSGGGKNATTIALRWIIEVR